MSNQWFFQNLCVGMSVFWQDPDADSCCSRNGVVHTIFIEDGEDIEPDSMVFVKFPDGGEAEVYACELYPPQKTEVVIVVEGGCVVAVYAKEPKELDVILIDRDDELYHDDEPRAVVPEGFHFCDIDRPSEDWV